MDSGCSTHRRGLVRTRSWKRSINKPRRAASTSPGAARLTTGRESNSALGVFLSVAPHLASRLHYIGQIRQHFSQRCEKSMLEKKPAASCRRNGNTRSPKGSVPLGRVPSAEGLRGWLRSYSQRKCLGIHRPVLKYGRFALPTPNVTSHPRAVPLWSLHDVHS